MHHQSPPFERSTSNHKKNMIRTIESMSHTRIHACACMAQTSQTVSQTQPLERAPEDRYKFNVFG